MSEAPTEQAAQQQEAVEQPQVGGDEAAKTFDAEYVAKLRAEAANYRTEAKAAKSELERARTASMSESEKAVAEAETRGRSAAAVEFGQRLARTEFDALAGRRNPDYDTASALEYVDLKRFVGEDGEPDKKAIAAAVERLVPAAAGSAVPPSLDLGQRTVVPTTTGMSGLIRKAAGRA